MKKLSISILALLFVNSIFSQNNETNDVNWLNKVEIRAGATMYFDGASNIGFAMDSTGFGTITIPDGSRTWVVNKQVGHFIEDMIWAYNAEIHIPTKKDFCFYLKGNILIGDNNQYKTFFREQGEDIDAYFSVTSQFSGGGLYFGASKKVGGQKFGVFANIGIGVSSWVRKVNIIGNITDNTYSTSIYYQYSKHVSDGFTSISGDFSFGPYLNFKQISINPSYTASFGAKSSVGAVTMTGVNLSVGFKF